MNQELQDRIEEYLDGRMDPEESRRFEQELLQEDVAAEFRELLLLRDLLGRLPPEQPPPGLVERIEFALAVNEADRPERQKAMSGQRLGWLVDGAKAGWGWTGYALAGLSGGPGVFKASVGGMQKISYSLGPLREPARKGVHAVQLQPKALWKRALSGIWRGLFS